MIKAVFFDLDDTLCDYQKSVEKSFQAAFELAKRRSPELSYQRLREDFETLLERAIASKDRTLAFSYARKDRFHDSLLASGIDDESLAERMADVYSQARRESLYLFDDARSTLKYLRQRYHLGLITNGPSSIQRDEIEILNIAGYFEHILISEEVGYEKPDPRIFLMGVELVGSRPGETLYVGNSPFHDILGGKTAGLLVAWLNRNGRALEEGIPRPDHEIKSLSELLRYLA